MLKKVLIALGIVVILGVVAIIAAVALTPTECFVEREIVVDQPKDVVFEYVKHIKNQNDWGPWFKQDPAMHQESTGTDGTPGFVTRWKSETMGVGEQEIMNIVPDEKVHTQLRFIEPFESSADAYLTTVSMGDSQTKVKWAFNTQMPRPLNIMLLFVDMDGLIGKDFEEGLASLKDILERQDTQP